MVSILRTDAASKLLVCIVMSTPALGGTIRHDRSDQLYLDLGASSDYEAVGMFEWLSGGTTGLASGTLISDEWVLTAGHVVDDPDATNLEFTVGNEVYSAVEYIIHPNWTGDVSLAGDLALVRLDRAVESVTAANLYTGTDEVGETTTVVGFGMTGTGLTGYYLSAGDKRAGNNLIGGLGDVIGYSSSSLMCDFDYPNPNATGKAISLDLEYMAAPGDSGGGWFIEVDGVDYLVGVTSFGYAPDGIIDSDYGDIMGATRVGDYLDWITSIVVETLSGDFDEDGDVDLTDLMLWQRGGSPDPFSEADLAEWKLGFQAGGGDLEAAGFAVPEPQTAALLGINMILLGSSRSRRRRY